ncbi:hypothetical protein M8J75_013412 [Diaphorina citri]|nr:hypothetical protein M8J75_013412 [Diaphorina citri]
MGRTSAITSSRPVLRIHYDKLVEDYPLMSELTADAATDLLSYSCHQCGHHQLLQFPRSLEIRSLSALALKNSKGS